ncbi:MAG: LytTR family DNA-binding domain-containing protein [Lachnospiraceae bacterium]|nr:LytTR family DNA-binding domain-containing protein [Lachnospiraceae bacterium]
MRVVIVDDDINSIRTVKHSLEKYEDLEVVDSFCKGEELFDYLKTSKVDLVILDIELGAETGFLIARKLKKKYEDLLFLFLTGHASYAIDGYDFHPVDFLTKPIREEKLDSAMEEVRRRLGTLKDDSDAEILFHLNNGYRMIRVQDICVIERRNRRNIMILEKEEFQIGRYSMKELCDMLEPHGFFLCHQSFLVQRRRIEAVNDEGRQQYSLKLKGYKEAIPVSRNKYEELISLLKESGFATL